MVLDARGLVSVRSGYNEVLWGVTMTVVHQSPLGLNSVSYNIMLFLDGDYRDEAGWHTWKKNQ